MTHLAFKTRETDTLQNFHSWGKWVWTKTRHKEIRMKVLSFWMGNFRMILKMEPSFFFRGSGPSAWSTINERRQHHSSGEEIRSPRGRMEQGQGKRGEKISEPPGGWLQPTEGPKPVQSSFLKKGRGYPQNGRQDRTFEKLSENHDGIQWKGRGVGGQLLVPKNRAPPPPGEGGDLPSGQLEMYRRGC